MCFNFLFFYFFISYFLFLSLHQHRGKETCEEDDRGAKDDSKVGMQMDAWKVPDGSKGYPGDDQDACHTTEEGCQAIDFLRDATQEEQSQHAT